MKSHFCRCGNCNHKRDKFRPSLKRWKLEDVYIIIRTKILEIIKNNKGYVYVTVEEFVTDLRAKRSLVDQVFAKLNLEGLLSQGFNKPPHDCKREKSGFSHGNDSSWQATIYKVRNDSK